MERLTVPGFDWTEDSIRDIDRWSLAECLNRLSDYEDTGLTPEQIRQIDVLYAEKCREVAELQKAQRWIPVEERMPEDDNYIFMAIADCPFPIIGRYKEDAEGGAFYIGDENNSCVSQDLYVAAWRPFPDPYRPDETTDRRPEWKDRMLNTFLGGHV